MNIALVYLSRDNKIDSVIHSFLTPSLHEAFHRSVAFAMLVLYASHNALA